MKKSLLIIFVILCISAVGQNVPRFTKVDIMNSGCKAYFPGTPTNFTQEYSDDSSKVYTGSFDFAGFTYGIIAVKFKQPQVLAANEYEDLLISYMDFLKTHFNVKQAVGYGKGHTHTYNTEAKGVIDYWEDEDKNELAVKGWIDSKYIGFMYIKGKGEYPYYNAQSMFLNGFVFGK